MKPGRSSGRIPEKVMVRARAIGAAGLANDVEPKAERSSRSLTVVARLAHVRLRDYAANRRHEWSVMIHCPTREQERPQMSNREEELNFRLKSLHERFDWIADENARREWARGFAATPALYDEKVHLLERAEDVLLELMKQPGAHFR
jgi:hypothetical protein